MFKGLKITPCKLWLTSTEPALHVAPVCHRMRVPWNVTESSEHPQGEGHDQYGQRPSLSVSEDNFEDIHSQPFPEV